VAEVTKWAVRYYAEWERKRKGGRSTVGQRTGFSKHLAWYGGGETLIEVPGLCTRTVHLSVETIDPEGGDARYRAMPEVKKGFRLEIEKTHVLVTGVQDWCKGGIQECSKEHRAAEI